MLSKNGKYKHNNKKKTISSKTKTAAVLLYSKCTVNFQFPKFSTSITFDDDYTWWWRRLLLLVAALPIHTECDVSVNGK